MSVGWHPGLYDFEACGGGTGAGVGDDGFGGDVDRS